MDLTDIHARGVQPLDGRGRVAVRLQLRFPEHLDEVGAEVLTEDLEGVVAALCRGAGSIPVPKGLPFAFAIFLFGE